jgi:hypothetical protein
MVSWPPMATIWVSPETAIKMQQSGEGIKLIQPSCKNESKNGLMAFFPLYFSDIPL